MANPGRNATCPCGSGRKYKRCCGSNEAPLLQRFEESFTPASATPDDYTGEQLAHAQQELQQLLAAFDSTSVARDDNLRSLLEKHLLKYFPPAPLRTLSLEWYTQAPPLLQSVVYWSELDCITAHVRRWVFNLVQARIRSVLEQLGDAITCAMHLRQLLELGTWAIYYQYGCTVGFNMLQRIVEQQGTYIYLFPSLENFIRGAVAPQPDRLRLVLELAGGGELPPDISQSVGELSASLSKQGEILRFISEEYDRRQGTHLLDHYETMDRVYYLCCGLVHPTPLLALSTELGHDPEQLRKAMRVGALRAIRSILHLLDLWYFNPIYVPARLAPVVRPHLPKREEDVRVLRIESEILDKLKHQDDKVLATLQDGSKLNLYSGRRRPRP